MSPDAEAILALPIGTNDADAETVGQYLTMLFTLLWVEQEAFSGKRPFGNSGWDQEVYIALAAGGFIKLTLDQDGFIDEFDRGERIKADELVVNAISEALWTSGEAS